MTSPEAPILYELVVNPIHCKFIEPNLRRADCSTLGYDCPIDSGLKNLGQLHIVKERRLTEEKIRAAFDGKPVDIELTQQTIIVTCKRDKFSSGGVLFPMIPPGRRQRRPNRG